jgi:hypothetical protein
MKDLIHQIEEACGYKRTSTQPTNQRASSSSVPAQKEKNPSDAFDKFGDESLFVKNNSKVEDLSKSAIHKNTSNVFSVPPSTLASSTTITPSTSQKIPQSVSKNAL